jgi:hypothetical protein
MRRYEPVGTGSNCLSGHRPGSWRAAGVVGTWIRRDWACAAGPGTIVKRGQAHREVRLPADRGRDGPPYFLIVGDEGLQHEASAGLAALVLGLLAVIVGLLPVIAGLAVPFHGSMAFSCMRLRQSKAGCRRTLGSSGKFSLAMPPNPLIPSSRDSSGTLGCWSQVLHYHELHVSG